MPQLNAMRGMQPEVTRRASSADFKFDSETKLPTLASQERTITYMALTANAWRRGVPGGVIDTGVFRGGSTIAMMHVLGLLNSTKDVWAADSFQGLPSSAVEDTIGCKGGKGSCMLSGVAHAQKGHAGEWKSTRSTFDANVAYYRDCLPGGPSRFSSKLNVLEGWFDKTLPPKSLKGNSSALSFLRLDGDVYESTKVALEALYPLLAPGGLVYVDDYGSYAGCARAIDDFVKALAIKPTIHRIWQWRTRPEIAGTNSSPQFEAVWWVKGGGAAQWEGSWWLYEDSSLGRVERRLPPVTSKHAAAPASSCPLKANPRNRGITG